jgi:hypothetical protein
VSGRTVATFRARQGRLIRALLRPQPPAGYEQELSVAVCVRGRGAYLVGEGSPGNVYVIPSRLSAVAMSFGSTWTSYNEGPAPLYFGGGAVAHGLPSGISRSFHRSALARVKLTARRGPVAGSGLIELQGRSGGCGGGGVFEVGVTRPLPTRFTAYVTPGSWNADELVNDGVVGRAHDYHAGHSYHVTLNRAAWGPRAQLPYTGVRGHLYVGTAGMFTDAVDEFLDSGARSSTKYKLTHHGRTILSRTVHPEGIEPTPKLPGPGWYTLRETGIRPQNRLFKGAFSPRTELLLHFRTGLADGRQIRGYLTTFDPAGLDIRNRAVAHSVTPVELGLRRDKPSDDWVKQLADSVHRVRAWASLDHGNSWHAIAVQRSHGIWTALVHDPASGAISLRTEVIDNHNDASTTTVFDAYGVR